MQVSKGFFYIMVGSRGHLGSSGEITEQEQFGVRVLHKLGLMSEKAERRDTRRSRGVRPCYKTLLILLLPASPSDLLMSSESSLGLRAPGTADGQ